MSLKQLIIRGREGQGSGERRAASTTQRGHSGDAMVTHHSGSVRGAAPTAAPRRGALSEADYPAQPAGHSRRAARHARPPRATRAASRHASHRLGQHWRGEAASAGLGGGCSKSSEPEDTVQGVVSRLPQRVAATLAQPGPLLGRSQNPARLAWLDPGHCQPLLTCLGPRMPHHRRSSTARLRRCSLARWGVVRHPVRWAGASWSAMASWCALRRAVATRRG